MNKGIGLVLAGGGGKGAYQIGAWKALKEYGVDRNIVGISGTSVGALNAILVAQDSYELADRIWRSISKETILKVDKNKLILSLLEINLMGENIYKIASILTKIYTGGIFSREGLVNIIDKYINLENISRSKYKIYAAAYNLNRFKVDYLEINNRSSKDIKSILLASSALPVIYKKEFIEGSYYIDGGIKDNVPIKPLYDNGVRKFIVIHLSRDYILDKGIYSDAQIIEIAPSNHQGGLRDGTLDFSKEGVIRRINQGYEDTINILSQIYEMTKIQSKTNLILSKEIYKEQEFYKKVNELRNDRNKLKEDIDKLIGEY